MDLVIVESPNKTAKIRELLGQGFEVVATAGHFRDLPEHELGVDLETFEPTYVVHETKRGLLERIRAKAKAARTVYLATDADREGEAISWHLQEALHLRGAKRIRFQEITKPALQRALAAAGALDQQLVDAQQARRVLDRVVGYQVSPLLRVFGKGHSAGRVQSATLHLVVQREQEREAFKVERYWTAAVRYAAGFSAKAATVDDKGELAEVRFATESEARAFVTRAAGSHTVVQLKTEEIERRPKAPFTTSTLLQAASAQLGLAPEETMRVAQALFEAGLITYHRSDSVALSAEAVAMARDFIARDYPEALPDEAPSYKGKASAQEAHEAIRPTLLDEKAAAAELFDVENAFDKTTEELRLKLWRLIRDRFLASQCRPARLERTLVELVAGDTTWRAVGSVVLFPSFLRYTQHDEESAEGEQAEEPRLPRLSLQQKLEVAGFDVKAGQTKPPARYTKATLIRAMETCGIGRPSTYAATVKTLFERDYLAEEKKAVRPTPRGRLIDAALVRAFLSLLQVEYTAQLEERLDEIAAGKRPWQQTLRSWYGPFKLELEQAPAQFTAEAALHPELRKEQPEVKETSLRCRACAKPMLLRKGKHGDFYSCSGYPACDNSFDAGAEPSERRCPKCEGPMYELPGRYGRAARCEKRSCGGRIELSPVVEQKCPACSSPMRDRGDFFGCTDYPKCRGSLPKEALGRAMKSGARCPECDQPLLERKGAKGKFLGCAAYPKCRYTRNVDGKPSAKAREARHG